MWLIAAGMMVAEVPPLSLPEWMTGCWESRSGDRWTEECWTSPRAGIMLGSSRSGEGARLREWEAIQIILDYEAGEGPIVRMAYRASPNGRSPTVFAWSPSADPGITFYNVAHDYPQRIRYWREGKELVAEIALKDGSNARRWRYSPKGN